MLCELPRSPEACGAPADIATASPGMQAQIQIAATGCLQGRLHPLTLLLGVIGAVRPLILPMVALYLLAGGVTVMVVIALLLAASFARALARYLTVSYRIEGGELITREGIFERTERHIPLDRIQEIRSTRGAVHRLFGVVDASVETASGQRPEATLSVLSLSQAERLRRTVSERVRARSAVAAGIGQDPATGARDKGGANGDPSEVLLRLNPRDLVLAGITSNHLLSAIALFGALWAFMDDLVPRSFYQWIAHLISTQIGQLADGGIATALMAALVGLVILLGAILLFSITASIALFYKFTLAREGEHLRRSYGLVTKREISLPRRRIQLLEIKEGVLRRLFKLAALRADTAGSNFSDAEERKQGQDMLIPIAPRDEIHRLLGAIFHDLEAEPRQWTRTSRLAIARGAIGPMLICAAFAAGLSWYLHSLSGLWLLALLPGAYLVSLIRYRTVGYSLGEHYFFMRHGWLGRSTYILPIRNIQAVVVRQSPLDRKLGLATVVIDSAGQASLGGPRISNLPLAQALDLGRTLAYRAASMMFRW